jgi:hypothetical protein
VVVFGAVVLGAVVFGDAVVFGAVVAFLSLAGVLSADVVPAVSVVVGAGVGFLVVVDGAAITTAETRVETMTPARMRLRMYILLR